MGLIQGIRPASGILQSVVRRIFSDFEQWIIVIFDNFLILASDYADAADKLEKVLIRCQLHRLVLKMEKSWIGAAVVTFFGYEVRPGSWSLSNSRKEAISNMIFPANQKQMQSFLGAANFFHTHIPNYAQWASCLYECTTASFDWNPSTWTKDYFTSRTTLFHGSFAQILLITQSVQSCSRSSRTRQTILFISQ